MQGYAAHWYYLVCQVLMMELEPRYKIHRYKVNVCLLLRINKAVKKVNIWLLEEWNV